MLPTQAGCPHLRLPRLGARECSECASTNRCAHKSNHGPTSAVSRFACEPLRRNLSKASDSRKRNGCRNQQIRSLAIAPGKFQSHWRNACAKPTQLLKGKDVLQCATPLPTKYTQKRSLRKTSCKTGLPLQQNRGEASIVPLRWHQKRAELSKESD